MINKKLENALNEQINRELYSAYLYLGMAVHFESEGLKGFADWMKAQACEEKAHAMKIYDYLFATGGKPSLAAIQAVETQYAKSPMEVMQDVLRHEEAVTASINKLYELALAENDYKTQNFLRWFIDEQVEEEATIQTILDKCRYAEGKTGLLFLDKELGTRT